LHSAINTHIIRTCCIFKESIP